MDFAQAKVNLERSLAIVKPDAYDKSDEIEEHIRKAGYSILQCRKVTLTPEQASEFYAEHFGKMFFPSLVAYMSSGPINVLVLGKENCVKSWRELIGPTNALKAKQEAPNSLRATYGTDDQRNGLHGSDSTQSAEREIRFFFPEATFEPLSPESVRDYLAKNVNPTLIRGLTELCKQKPGEPVLWLADWLIANNPNKPKVN